MSSFFHKLGRVIHNPAGTLLPHNLRTSSGYRNVVRPIAKIGEGALAGFVTSGFNPAGAVAGGITSAIGGGLTNNPSRPLPNLVAPGLVGAMYNPSLQPTIMSGAHSLGSAIGSAGLGGGLAQQGLGMLLGGGGNNGGVAPQPLYAPPTPYAALSQAGLLTNQQGGGNNQGQNNQQVNDALGRADRLRRGVAV